MDSQNQDSPFSAVSLAVAAIALGQAVQIRSGTLHPQAMVWLTVSLLACAVAVTAPRLGSMDQAGERPALWVAMVGIAGQLTELVIDRPADFVQLPTARSKALFLIGIVLAAFIAGSGFSDRSWFGRMRMPLLFLIHLVLGIWLIRRTPDVPMDVDVFQRESLKAFLQGINPYGLTFPQVLHDPSLYGPTVAVDGRLTVGFPYPPLSLLMAVPGHLLGDFRYSQLLAITGAGALMAYARPTRLATFAATLFLFTPRVFFVLEEAWTEPFVVLLLAAVVFAACRAQKFLPLMLGLFLASKQYAFFAVPLVALLIPRPFQWRLYFRIVGIAVLIAAGITLPFFLWNVPGFWRGIVIFQILQPFRADALSYVAWFARNGEYWPQWIAFALAVAAAAFGVWRAKRTPAGFAAAAGLMFGIFFAFSKQAFCNYYFFVIGALCIGLSAFWDGEATARSA